MTKKFYFAKDEHDIPVEVQFAIKTFIDKTFDEMSCKCNLTETAQKEMNHFMGTIKDLGEGDMRAGVEVIRENHNYVKNVKGYGNKIADYIIRTTVVVTLAGALAAIYWGLRSKF